jgi:hypothetical protein
MSENRELIFYSLAVVFSIGFFNMAGVAVTKYASAA